MCIAGAAAYAPWLAAAPRVAVPVRQRRASAVRASTLDEWLDEEGSESDLSTILLALCNGCKLVASKIATASCDSTSCFNEINMREDDEEPEMLAILELTRARDKAWVGVVYCRLTLQNTPFSSSLISPETSCA